MSTCEEIGNRIRHLRNMHGLTQKELSEKVEAKNLSCSREVVNQWEGGRRDIKTAYTVALAEIFNVTCDYILRGIEAENIDVCSRTGLSQNAIELLEKMEEIKDNTREIVTSLEDDSDGEELDNKGKAILEESKESILQLIVNEYIINRFISYVAVNSNLADIVFDAINSTITYLNEEEQRVKAKNRFRRDISAAKFDASQWFMFFFDSIRKSPGLIRAMYGDSDDVETIITLGQSKKILN